MAKRKNNKSAAYVELERRHKLLAKAADQRLRELENLKNKKGFENVLDYAYAKAMKMIEKWSGKSDKMRFDRKPPSKISSLRAKISDIERFMKMKTSTYAKIKHSYIDAAKTTNANFGTNFTWEDLGEFFESEQWKKLMEKGYGSDTAMLVVAQIQQNHDYILNMLQQHKPVHFNLKNQLVGDLVEQTINEYGLDVVDLF